MSVYSFMDKKEESTPETPKEEKTHLDFFKEFVGQKQTHRFLPYWSKVTKTPEPILYYIKTELIE